MRLRAGTSVAPLVRVRIAGWSLALLVIGASSLPLTAQQSRSTAQQSGDIAKPSVDTAQQSVDTAQQQSPISRAKQEVQPDPQDDGRLKTTARRFGTLVSPGEDEGVKVSLGIIVAGSSLSGGLGYKRLNVFKTIDLEVEGNVSVRRYQDYRVAIGLLESRDSTLELDVADRKVASLFNTTSRKSPGSALYFDLRYRDYPRHTYYGPGMESPEEFRSDYALRGISAEGVWQWQITPTTGVSARGGVLDLEIGSGTNDALLNFEDRFVTALVPGAQRQPLFVTYGAAVVHDTRTEPGAPDDGHVAGIALRRYSASDAPALSFTRLTLDARAYRRLRWENGVLAVRGLVSSDVTDSGAATPFYLQQSLGGGETLRGFHSYRFPDQALAHASIEYRWRAHRYVEIAPFLDAGTVAPSLSRLSPGSVKMSPGVGIRARNDRRVLARLDFGWGTEGARVVVGMGPAF